MLDVFRTCRSLAALVKKHEVDVIQTHLLRVFDFVALPLLYTTKLRALYWTFHNANFELTPAKVPKWGGLLKIKNSAYRLFYRSAAKLVNGFVAVSDEVKNSMVRIIGPIGDKTTVICNGVDTERYQQPIDRAAVRQQIDIAEEDYLIIVLATFKKQKGHRYLIEAMSSLVQKHPQLHTIFVGDGPLREEIEIQIAELNLGNHIHLLGSRHDIPQLLGASDLFVLPSLWEGLAMALLEGMATGLPVVASEVSGTIQVVIPGETGFLVPPGDVECLGEAIEKLLCDPTLAQAMGAAGRKRVQAEFSARKQADEHLALYLRQF
jgi:glycosyltransferase involved in cell wall biosynthesis